MLLVPRRRLALAFLSAFVLVFFYFSLDPQSMSTALRRVTQIRTHLAATAVPTSSTTTTTARQATLASRPFTSSPIIGSSQSTVNMSDVKLEVDQAIKDNFVMVFSKSYCPVSLSLSAVVFARHL